MQDEGINPLTREPMPLIRRFGMRLAWWRRDRQLTSMALGRRLGCSGTYVLNWESGLKPPPARDSAIGQRLYGMVELPRPTAYEQFLWAMWSTPYQRDLILMVKELGAAYFQVQRSGLLEPIWQDVWGDVETDRELGQRMQALELENPGDAIDWLMACCTTLTFDFERRIQEPVLFADEPTPVDPMEMLIGHLPPEPPRPVTEYHGRIVASLRWPIPSDSPHVRLRNTANLSIMLHNAWDR